MTPWMEPIQGASTWTPGDLKHDQSWEYGLTAQQKTDLDKVLQRVKEHELEFGEIKREDFSLPSLQQALDNMLNEIRDGRGFVMVRGFPTGEYDYEDLEQLY